MSSCNGNECSVHKFSIRQQKNTSDSCHCTGRSIYLLKSYFQNMKHIFTTIFLLTTFIASAQDKWNVSLEPQKVFIENNSQFDDLKTIAGSEILFATEHGSTQFIFTRDGITCLLKKTEHLKPDAEERKKGKTQT